MPDPRRILKADQHEAFAADWRAGVRVKVMAETYSLSNASVVRYARRMGLPRRYNVRGR